VTFYDVLRVFCKRAALVLHLNHQFYLSIFSGISERHQRDQYVARLSNLHHLHLEAFGVEEDRQEASKAR
jgi:hypothetical protein